ncbi:MAG: PAS domain-containing protein [Methanocella sp.]
MAAKSGSRKNAKGTGSIDAGKDSLNEKLENRVLVLEKELQSRQEDLLARIDELRRKNEGLEDRLRERERAEQALHESEERFRILADEAPVLIWVNGLEGGEYVNRAYLEFLGLSSQVDIRHYDWSQYVHPDDREGYLARYLDCFRRQARFDAQFRFRRHDGTYRWMKSVGQPRFNPAGQFLGFVGSTQDITDVKQIESALRESEERLDFSLKSAGIGAWDLDLIDHTAWRSPRHDQIFGYKEQLPEWTYEIFLSHVLPEDRDIVESSFQKAVAGHVDCDYRCRIRRVDGEVRWMWAHGRPVYDERGQPIRMLGINVDITARKLMEDEVRRSRDELEVLVKARTEELRQREERLSLAQRMAKLGSWSYDIKNDRNYWSDELYQMLGLAHDKPFISIADLLSHIHHEDAVRFGKLYEKALQDRQPYGQDLRFIKPDGSILYLYTEAYIDCDDKGRPAQVHGFVQDITERKLVEEKSEHVASFPEFNPCPIFEVDETGRIKYSNPAADQVYPDLKTSGMNHPLLKDIAFGQDAISKGESLEFVRDVEINGVYYQQTILYMPKSKTTRIYCIDITERKRAEEALRRSETGLKKSQEIARLGSWELDLVNDRLTWSDEVYRIFGLRPQEFGATYEAFLEAVHPDDRAAVDAAYSGSIREGRDTYEIVHRVVRKTTGEVRYVHEKCTHFRDRSRRIIRSVGMVQDITEHKRVEDELIAAKQQAELYLDLMGHDINNMHQIAMGYLEIARDMPAIEGQSEFLDKPFEVLQRSARLIKNVRKLQKLRDGAFQPKVIDVCKVLVDVQREFGAVPNKSVTLNLNGCESSRVHANELLHDVFANLVSNAIKHTGDHADIVVDLDVVKERGHHNYRIFVEDDGPGIPDDFKDIIFNRLLKGTEKAKGMGLGLYLVKSLVESYDGKVWVEDRVHGDYSKGARFVVMLPVAEM